MIVPNLHFNGQAGPALKFYEEVFGSKASRVVTYGEFDAASGSMPEEYKNWIIYSQLELFAGNNLVLNDAQPGANMPIGENFSIIIQLPEEQRLKELFAKLEVGGTVVMPLGPTPFSELYGMLTDKFGTVWQFTI